jgi:hypothetical protein
MPPADRRPWSDDPSRGAHSSQGQPTKALRKTPVRKRSSRQHLSRLRPGRPGSPDPIPPRRHNLPQRCQVGRRSIATQGVESKAQNQSPRPGLSAREDLRRKPLAAPGWANPRKWLVNLRSTARLQKRTAGCNLRYADRLNGSPQASKAATAAFTQYW